MLNRDDGWAFGIEFFIQAALFKLTGYADWRIKTGTGCRHNMTDGEVDYFVSAYRVLSEDFNGHVLQKTKFPKFGFNANAYSWKSIYQSALAAAKEAKRLADKTEKREAKCAG